MTASRRFSPNLGSYWGSRFGAQHSENASSRTVLSAPCVRLRFAGTVGGNGEPSMIKPFLAALAGERQTRPPIWLMRQAGRYLPEYRELRTTHPLVPRFLLHAEACHRGDLAADPALRLRRGDPVLQTFSCFPTRSARASASRPARGRGSIHHRRRRVREAARDTDSGLARNGFLVSVSFRASAPAAFVHPGGVGGLIPPYFPRRWVGWAGGPGQPRGPERER